jgi:hypothetical protein
VPTSVSVKNMWLHLLTSTPRMHSQPAWPSLDCASFRC